MALSALRCSSARALGLGCCKYVFPFRPLSISLKRANQTSPSGNVFGLSEKLQLDRNVVLYKADKGSHLFKLHVMSLICGLTCIYSAGVLYVFLQERPKTDQEEDLSVYSNVFTRIHPYLVRWKLGLACFFVVFGLTQWTLLSLFIKRSVHSIILMKNCEEIILNTYKLAPIESRPASVRLPLSKVSCLTGRLQKTPYLSLSVEGRWKYFLIDSNGIFYSPNLFDQTVGVFRKFTK